MTTVLVKVNQIVDRGQWRLWLNRVMASCPKCGLIASLNHEVSEKGLVTPSLQCPDATCGFHESGVVLKDWSGKNV